MLDMVHNEGLAVWVACRSSRGARMTFMVRGRRTENVTVSVRRQCDGRRLDVQMMQVADALVKQCSPQQQDT
jgi:membrane-bound inhibitor of C-type lysozyme